MVAPDLEKIGGTTSISKGLEARNLREVGGYLLNQEGTMQLDSLKKVKKLTQSHKGRVIAPRLREVENIVLGPAVELRTSPLAEEREAVNRNGQWQGRVSKNRIYLNAAALDPEEVESKIRHELAHMAWRNAGVRDAFEKLWAATPERTKAEIKKIAKKHYPSQEHEEEARVRAFEIMAREAPQGLWQKLMESIQRFWRSLTGENSGLDSKEVRRLGTQIISEGIKELTRARKMEEAELAGVGQ